MKFASPLLLLALGLAASLAIAADDKDKQEKLGEWTMTIGCAKCDFARRTGATACSAAGKTAYGKVVLLTGDAMKDIKYHDGGSYLIKGKVAPDGKSIEVREITKKV